MDKERARRWGLILILIFVATWGGAGLIIGLSIGNGPLAHSDGLVQAFIAIGASSPLGLLGILMRTTLANRLASESDSVTERKPRH